jgi:putative transposase
MTNYRRIFVPGGRYFFTVNLADRRSTLLTDNVAVLREAFREIHVRHPFVIDEIVVLPDHLHAIWTMPEDNADYPLRWRLIKSAFSRSLPRAEVISASRVGKAERGIWQRRYWEHAIRNDEDFARHVEYIHFNPVKHGYVRLPEEWPFSSIHRDMRTNWSDEIS